MEARGAARMLSNSEEARLKLDIMAALGFPDFPHPDALSFYPNGVTDGLIAAIRREHEYGCRKGEECVKLKLGLGIPTHKGKRKGIL
jgi:hypothetical protein